MYCYLPVSLCLSESFKIDLNEAKAVYISKYLICCFVIRLPVVPLLFSPSSEMRKKTTKKNGRARSWRIWLSSPSGYHTAIFSPGFLLRLARRTKRRIDYS